MMKYIIMNSFIKLQNQMNAWVIHVKMAQPAMIA